MAVNDVLQQIKPLIFFVGYQQFSLLNYGKLHATVLFCAELYKIARSFMELRGNYEQIPHALETQEAERIF